MGYNVSGTSQILGAIQIAATEEWNCYWTTSERFFSTITIASCDIGTDMVRCIFRIQKKKKIVNECLCEKIDKVLYAK